MGTRLEPLEGDEEKVKNFQDVQRATLNLLEDFDAEKKRLEEVQRATINILDDFNSEKSRSEQSQRALLNILEDMDVEKRKVAEVNQQLGAVNKELEAFSYSVSRDLRAPLRQISGFAGLLADEYGPRLEAPGQRHLKLIQEGARSMGQLVDDLINMGWIGRQELVRKPTDLNALLQDVLKDLQWDLGNRHIEWRISELPTLQCDPGLIKQVLINLLSNAVKYTRYRECALIEIGQTTREGERAIFVGDNGVGFDQKYVHKLFGVFQRLHRAEEFEGTGVGLAIVQRIIQKHGGRVWAEGIPGKGATFFFTLKADIHRGGEGGNPVNDEVNHGT